MVQDLSGQTTSGEQRLSYVHTRANFPALIWRILGTTQIQPTIVNSADDFTSQAACPRSEVGSGVHVGLVVTEATMNPCIWSG